MLCGIIYTYLYSCNLYKLRTQFFCIRYTTHEPAIYKSFSTEFLFRLRHMRKRRSSKSSGGKSSLGHTRFFLSFDENRRLDIKIVHLCTRLWNLYKIKSLSFFQRVWVKVEKGVGVNVYRSWRRSKMAFSLMREMFNSLLCTLEEAFTASRTR